MHGYWRDASLELNLQFSVRATWLDPVNVVIWGGLAKVYDDELPLPAIVDAHEIPGFSAHGFQAKIRWTPTQQQREVHGLDAEVLVLGVDLMPVLNLEVEGERLPALKPTVQLTVMVQRRSAQNATAL